MLSETYKVKVFQCGREVWLQDGKTHRVGGPAVKHSDGTEEWYFDGQLHRDDGPAVTKLNVSKEYYYKGLHHRLDGPAIINHTGRYWFVYGKQYLLEKNYLKRVDKELKGISAEHSQTNPDKIKVDSNIIISIGTRKYKLIEI